MPKKTNKSEDKKRNNYSFSIKKTDSPLIGKFAEKQENFSESVRYLILKFCRENGVQDISHMLNEYMYFQVDGASSFNGNNQENITKEIVKEEPKIVQRTIEKEVIEDNSNERENLENEISNNAKDISTKKVPEIKNEANDEIDIEDEIPSCYRTK